MKTKQGNAVRAYVVLQSMGRRQLNTVTAFKLFRLKKKLHEIVEFQTEQERTLAESLGGTIDEHGRLIISDDKRAEYEIKHALIADTDCEIDTEKVTLPMAEIPYSTIEELEALDPFIELTE